MGAEHERHLRDLAVKDRLRRLALPAGVDFASNDYLGLANSSQLRDAVAAALARGVAVGAGGSRLLRGHHEEHEALEADAAAFFGAQTTLFFGSGFLANLAIFSALPQRGDIVVHDALIHASAHDGMRLGRAERVQAQHNDAQAFDDAIADWRGRGGKGQPWIAVESLYSMDGDRAPLDDLISIADRHDGWLIVDEAHATGVFGPDGRGLGAHLEGRPNVVSLHTCGKALGAAGAFVCGSLAVRDFLINRGRSFIYATAPPPIVAASVRGALEILRTDPHRRERLLQLNSHASKLLQLRCGIPPSGSQILPVILGDDARAIRAASVLQAAGFDIRAIRPPTVPEGTARLRICITLNCDAQAISAMAAVLGGAIEKA